MKFTNKLKLPEALVRTVEKLVNEPHNKPGEYSVTTLLLGPKEVQLTSRHFDEIEEDVSKELWAVFGTAIHALLERNARVEDGSISEYAMAHEMHWSDGELAGKITGRCDLLREDESGELVLEDYKTSKSSAIKFGDTVDKWHEQLACYCALLFATAAIRVQKVRIIALLKDWSELEAKRSASEGYPDAPVAVFEWEISDEERATAYRKMCDRFWLQTAAAQLGDDEIPECSFEERWAKESKYAIVKAGAVKATKLCNTKDEALQLIRDKYGPEMYGIEERPGEDTKCLYFCKAKQFCSYYKKKYSVQLKKEDEQ